jgi:hypothetical protein
MHGSKELTAIAERLVPYESKIGHQGCGLKSVGRPFLGKLFRR